ncbi:MAG: pinensin family lanthipeptide [Cyclobacteriaceae bacterium]
MKKKLEITGLKVESFVTDMERPNTKDIKGGGPDTKGDQCQRTSYLGYTYCSCI